MRTALYSIGFPVLKLRPRPPLCMRVENVPNPKKLTLLPAANSCRILLKSSVRTWRYTFWVSCGFWCFWTTRFRNVLLCMSLLNHRLLALSRSQEDTKLLQLGFFPQLVLIFPIFLTLLIGLLLSLVPGLCSLSLLFSDCFQLLLPGYFGFQSGKRGVCDWFE